MNKYIKIIAITLTGMWYFGANAAAADQGQKQINDCIGAVIGDCTAGNVSIGTKTGERKEVNWCVGAVSGDCVGGDVSIGTASDKPSVVTEGILIQNLGALKKDQTIELSLLLSGQKIIAFTPTEGDYKNRQFKILALAVDLNNIPTSGLNKNLFADAANIKRMNPNAQTLFKIYRQLPDESQWSLLNASVKAESFAALKPKLGFTTNGAIKYYPPIQKNDNGIDVQPEPITYNASAAK